MRGDVQLVVQTAQPAAQLLAHLGVERAERLVEQQHARLDGERARERDALALAARQLRGIAIREPVELHELEQLVHLGADLALRARRSARGLTRKPKATLSNTRHVPEQRVVLEDEADLALAHVRARSILARRAARLP